MKLDIRVLELDLKIGDGGFGRLLVGFRGSERFLHVGVVECGEKLALFDDCAFVEKDASDPASNFRGERRATARSHVAARIEKRFAASGSDGLVDDADLDNWFLIPESVDSAGDTAEDHKDTEEDR